MREDGRVVSSLDGLRELGLAGEDELLRSLLDSTGDGVYATDLDGVCTFANPACVELLGFASDQGLLGQQVHRLVHHTRANGEPYPVEGCPIYRAFDQGEGVHVADEVMFRADGARFPAEYRSHPLFRDGQWWDAWSRSTTSPLRLEVEQALQTREEEFSAILSSTGKAIYGTDLAGNCTFANPACAELLGFESIDDLQLVDRPRCADVRLRPPFCPLLTHRLLSFVPPQGAWPIIGPWLLR